MPNAAPNSFTPLATLLGYARPPVPTHQPALSPLIAPFCDESPVAGIDDLACETAGDGERERRNLDALPLAKIETIAPDAAAIGAELRCFRARLADAFEAASRRLTADFAVALLGRELELAPVMIERIAARVLAEYWSEEPLRLRVSPFDAPVTVLDLPVVVDPSLRAGDCAVDVADGSHDASLGIRLAAVVERACSRANASCGNHPRFVARRARSGATRRSCW